MNKIAQFMPRPQQGNIASGGEPPHDTDMEERVTRLETTMQFVLRDLNEIKADNKTIISKLGDATAQLAELPQKRDLLNYSLGGLAIGIAIIAMVIGGVIGGLAILR